ncbi:MAG: type II toxin-antitoxin system RelE/ParE family toxin [bacterium]|nr:type II toxin-antitoxin system RelE/ParE family toxin [bacterium]MDE0668325.1 type II toxin-antitoxin system RelE/ParE family toxin [bacterium]MXZ30989.1 peptidase [Acidimicrobiia bacterium]MYB24284.1 peptidase [Acidimicrobiia bacterium]MYJ12860.1 peptidase [Acidimicrobiia bacterium]
MIRTFRHRGLRRLYERDDASRVAPDQLERIIVALADLDAADKPGDLDLPGYRLHPLRGDRRGLWSISISSNWRITFRVEDGDVYEVDLVDYH